MLKKLLVLFIFIITITSLCFASEGDFAGRMYETGKTAIINGIEVKLYSVDGRYYVLLDDLGMEGFAYSIQNKTIISSNEGYGDHFDIASSNSEKEIVVYEEEKYIEIPTIEEIVNYHISLWNATVVERYDTDDYSILYMTQRYANSTSPLILYVKNDGTYQYLHHKLDTNNLYNLASVTRVVIDREAHTISFTDNSNGNRFVFNLQTGKMISGV